MELSVTNWVPEECEIWASLTHDERAMARSIAGFMGELSARGASVSEIVSTTAQQYGIAQRTMWNRYKAWADTGSLPALVGKLVARGKTGKGVGLSPETRDWIITTACQYQRATNAAIRKMRHCMMNTPANVPGWVAGQSVPSIRTIYRIIGEAKIDLSLSRSGLSETAATMLPSVLTTREGMKVGEAWQFDDVWHDNYIIVGQRSVRALEFGALDVASGCRPHWGLVARTLKEDGKMRGLDGKMFRMFLFSLLRYTGYHKDGCLLMMEHGTATLDAKSRAVLESVDGGKIRIGMGGMQGARQALFGGWAGRGKGNPRYKSMLESLHNLIHNELAFLPGQTGHDRIEPEGTHGLVRYAESLARLSHQLEARGQGDFAARLRSPLLTLDEFMQISSQVYAIINNRTEHKLEGWTLNHVIEINVGEGWMPIDSVPSESAELVRSLAQRRPEMIRKRRMSPAEVWDRGQSELVRIPHRIYLELLGDEKDFGRSVFVKKGEIRVKDSYVTDEELVYEARVWVGDGWKELPHRSRWWAVINPYHSEALAIFNLDGGMVGEAALVRRANRKDEHAIEAMMGHVASRVSDITRDARNRLQPVRDAAQELREANAEILADAGVASGAIPGKPKNSARKTQTFHNSSNSKSLGATATLADGLLLSEPNSGADLPSPSGRTDLGDFL